MSQGSSIVIAGGGLGAGGRRRAALHLGERAGLGT